MANIIIFVHMMLQILSLNIILIICSYRSFKMENPKKIEILNKAVEVNSNLSSNELYDISIDNTNIIATIGIPTLPIIKKGLSALPLIKIPKGNAKTITAKNLYEIKFAISESLKLFLAK